jgi:hypothetical protein
MHQGFTATEDPSLWVTMTQCAWCNGIKLGPWFLPIRHRIMKIRSIRLPIIGLSLVLRPTHGICPECLERVRGAKRRALWT